MTVGERIKARREALSMTQIMLADTIGTTKQNIYKYENGIITNIPSDKVESIAAALGVSPAYLMGWEDLLIHISEESNSGRTAAKEEMYRTFGTNHYAADLRLMGDKTAVLYYKATDRRSAPELMDIMCAVEELDCDELSNIRSLIRAYLQADEPIKKIVDTALQPYREEDS